MKKLLGVGAVLALGVAGWSWFSASSQPQAQLPPVPSQGSNAPPGADVKWLTAPVPEGKGSLTISGEVRGPDGLLAGATIVATRLDAEEDLSRPRCGDGCEQRVVVCGTSAAQATLADWLEQRRGEAPPIARAQSAEDGTFSLTGLEPGGHRLWAFHPAQGTTTVSPVAAGQTAMLRLGDGTSITGRVVDGEGKPLAGVWVRGFFPHAPRYFDAQTSADGVYEFGRLPAEPFILLVKHEGATEVSSVRLGQGADLEVRSDPEVKVRVLRGGAPFAGARVAFREGDHVRWLDTGAAGDVTAKLPVSRRASLSVSDGLLSARSDLSEARFDGGVTLELAPAANFVGTVTDTNGKPVKGAHVSLGYDLYSARTDAEGRYRLQVQSFAAGSQRERPVQITVRAEGYASQTREDLKADVSREAVVDFQLAAFEAVSGRVLDPLGNPLENAVVAVDRPARVDARASAFDERVTSAADGTFTVKQAGPGQHTLMVAHAQWGELSIRLEVPASGVEARFKSGGEIFGTVLDERGAPVAAQLALMPDRDLMGAGEANAPADRDGVLNRDGGFQFLGVSAGNWVLVVGEGDRRSLRGFEQITLAEGERKRIDVVVREGLTLSGRVVDADGEPIRGARIIAAPPGTDDVIGAMKTSRMLATLANRSDATTDARGAFEFRHLKPGPWELSVQTAGRREPHKSAAQAGDRGITITLPVAPSVKGRVVDGSGKPIARFQVGPQSFDTPTGEFKVPIVTLFAAPTVTVLAEGFPARTLSVPKDSPQWPVDLGDVVMSAGRALEVTVVDESSAPIPGAQVTLVDDPGFRGLPLQAPGTTDAAGRAKFLNLAAQTMFLRVRAPGRAEASLTVPATETQAQVVLNRGGTIQTRLRARDGGNSEMAQVTVGPVDGGRSELWPRPDGPGRFVVGDVPAGRWLVRAELGPGHLKLEPKVVDVTAGGTVELDFVEASDGVEVTLDFVDAKGDAMMVMPVLVPGEVAAPTDAASLRSIRIKGTRVARFEPAVVRPGVYTVVGMTGSMTGDKMYVFAERVVVSPAPKQKHTVKVPAKLTEMKLQ